MKGDAVSTFTVVTGASYIKVKKEKTNKNESDVEQEKKRKRKEAPRGKTKTFSNIARRNMMYTLAMIRRDSLPCFVTLTYPKEYSSDASVWKKDLDKFCKRLTYKFRGVSAIWKLEPQRRGAPHYHLLVWGATLIDLLGFVPYAWNEIAAGGNVEHLRWHLGRIDNIPCVQQVDTQKQMYQYVLKYISKSAAEGWKYVGKWWGIVAKTNLPFGSEVVFEITEEVANEFIRYMRRFTNVGHGLALASRQQVCDADQWMEKMQTKPMGSYLDWLKGVDNERLEK